MFDFINKFLGDHGSLLAAVLAVNSGLSLLVVVMGKIQEIFGDKLPWLASIVGVLKKIADFMSANIAHPQAKGK